MFIYCWPSGKPSIAPSPPLCVICRYQHSYRELAKKHPGFRERSETTELIVEITLQPWRSFRPDGIILFRWELTLLLCLCLIVDVLQCFLLCCWVCVSKNAQVSGISEAGHKAVYTSFLFRVSSCSQSILGPNSCTLSCLFKAYLFLARLKGNLEDEVCPKLPWVRGRCTGSCRKLYTLHAGKARGIPMGDCFAPTLHCELPCKL